MEERAAVSGDVAVVDRRTKMVMSMALDDGGKHDEELRGEGFFQDSSWRRCTKI